MTADDNSRISITLKIRHKEIHNILNIDFLVTVSVTPTIQTYLFSSNQVYDECDITRVFQW